MHIDKSELLKATSSITLVEALLSLRDNEQLRKSVFENTGVQIPESFLMHGSHNAKETLQINVSDGGPNENREEALVYATDHPEYAIFLAVIELEDGFAGVGFDPESGDIDLQIDAMFVNGQSKLSSGYLHLLDPKPFKATSNHEFIASTDTPVITTIKVELTDLSSSIRVIANMPG